jgi:hypothetical protein
MDSLFEPPGIVSFAFVFRRESIFRLTTTRLFLAHGNGLWQRNIRDNFLGCYYYTTLSDVTSSTALYPTILTQSNWFAASQLVFLHELDSICGGRVSRLQQAQRFKPE